MRSISLSMVVDLPKWLARAAVELRAALARGEVREARMLINEALEALRGREPTSVMGFTDPMRFRSAFGELLSAVEAARAGDLHSAPPLLARLLEENAPADVRWLSGLWLSRVMALGGDLDEAEEVAADAMEVARTLSGFEVAATECLFSELDALDGAVQQGLDRLEGTVSNLERQSDKRGLALVWHTRAQILQRAGFETDAVAAASEAHAIDEEWHDPLLVLSRNQLRGGDLNAAMELLRNLEQPRPPEVERELALMETARAGLAPVWVITEFLDIRDAIPTDEGVSQLQVLSEQAPSCVPIRELLGWHLLRLGEYDEAQGVFRALSEMPLEPMLQSSIRVGLRSAVTACQRRAPARSVLESGSFRGDLALLPVPDLLQFLSTGGRNGLLVLAQGDRIGTICIQSGELAGATSPAFVHLGQRLHAVGVISQQVLQTLTPREPSAVMGWVDLPDGVEVPDGAVKAAFIDQVKAAVGELVSWAWGQFSFQSASACKDNPAPVTLGTQGVLLDALQSLNETQWDDETNDRSLG